MKKKFNIFIGNHDVKGRLGLLDFIEWIYFSLKSCDQDVIISKTFYKDRINIFFDNFTIKFSRYVKKNKIPYGIICTETPTGNTFNGIENFEMRYRKKVFDKMINDAIFVWTTWGKSSSFDYKNKFGYMKLVYLDEIWKRRLIKLGVVEKKRDFFFSGRINKFRDLLLKKLSKNFDVSINYNISGSLNYLKQLSKTKFFICFQQSENWPCIPTTKIMSALHLNSIPILLKPKSDSSELSKYFISVDINKLDECFQEISKKNYQFMIDDYKKDCSGKIIMEKLLNKISVSLTNIDNQDKKLTFDKKLMTRHNILSKFFIKEKWISYFNKIFKF